jgi:N-acetylneuraminic acid mutarotase
MLPQDVRDDLNKTVTITRNMLPADVLSDLNRTISKSMLGSDVLADLNKSSTTASPITLSMLAPEVTAKLDQNGSGGNTTIVNPPVVGSTLAVPHGSSAPTGYSMYHQVGQPKELVWEEKAPVSVARFAYDGVEVLDGKIYFVGGHNGSAKNIAERYNPVTNTWETLNSMSVARVGLASAVLNGKLYAIGGIGLSSVEIYDASTGVWSAGLSLPSEVKYGIAITVSGRIYLVGGQNAGNNELNQVLCFDPTGNTWNVKSNMPTARHGASLVWFKNRIWALGGRSSSISQNKVESYDPVSNTWQTEIPLAVSRSWPTAWTANGRLYAGGGYSPWINSIEFFNPTYTSWTSAGNYPQNIGSAGTVVLNDKVYVIAGSTASGVYSNKVFAADLNASMEGVYDLYRKDGNASAGTPLVQAEMVDGSVTASKIANKTIGKDQISDDILKYLKPEITTQPQAQTVYADTNASFSVTAEGKYLTYQWKKDGSDLTGETNATLNITDANATLHDGNYSVVVSNDFGSVQSGVVEINAIDALMNGLVAWWKFDETNGTVAYDSSGNGNDGNLAQGATWTDGIIGNAISLNTSTSQYMTSNVKYKPASDASGQSYSSWVKVEGQSWRVFGSDASGNGAIHLTVNGGQDHITFGTTSFGTGSNGESANTKNIPISLGWHNVILIKQANKYELFFDGSSLIADMQRNTSNTSTNFNLGRSYASSYYSGTIDDVRIYDRALSAAEVQALYNMGQ